LDAFRHETDPASSSETAEAAEQTGQSSDTSKLVSHLRETKRPSKPARNRPLRVAFPHFGPSIFLVAELTSENQTPVVELDFQRDKKRGVR
jgi:hypothetical protein